MSRALARDGAQGGGSQSLINRPLPWSAAAEPVEQGGGGRGGGNCKILTHVGHRSLEKIEWIRAARSRPIIVARHSPDRIAGMGCQGVLLTRHAACLIKS